MNIMCKHRFALYSLLLSLIVPVCGLAADWAWTDTTVPASNKASHGDRKWSEAVNWGDGTGGSHHRGHEARWRLCHCRGDGRHRGGESLIVGCHIGFGACWKSSRRGRDEACPHRP